MENTSPTYGTLEAIVRELVAPHKNNIASRDIMIITIDEKSGEIIHEPSIFSFRKLRHFEFLMSNTATNVQGPAVAVTYENVETPLKVSINYNVMINPKGAFRLARFLNQPGTAGVLLNTKLEQTAHKYIFKHADFVTEFSAHREKLAALLTEESSNVGLDILPTVKLDIPWREITPPEFVDCQHTVEARTSDGQVVEIKHALVFTLTDPIKFLLHKIDDLKSWARLKLDRFTLNAVIEQKYSEVLLGLDENAIKKPMEEAVRAIGYELKQLISAPGLDSEKFYFETGDESMSGQREYNTNDAKFKIALNVIVEGRLDLQATKTQQHIKPGFDIIYLMKRETTAAVRSFANTKTPAQCFIEFEQFEIDLINRVKSSLRERLSFNDLQVIVRILGSDLSDRFYKLQARPFPIRFEADFKERNFDLLFQVTNVSANGWHRFRANNNYENTEEELSAIGRLIEYWMTNAMLRRDLGIDSKLVNLEFKKAAIHVEREFGLEIRIHAIKEGVSIDEGAFIQEKVRDLEERARQNELLRAETTIELDEAIRKRQELKTHGEEVFADEIRVLDERIGRLTAENSKQTKEKFIARTTTSDFLLPDQPDQSIEP